jgi:hypothetical protein
MKCNGWWKLWNYANFGYHNNDFLSLTSLWS